MISLVIPIYNEGPVISELLNRSLKTLEEIGKEFKLTRERVRQIKEKALIRLRHQSRAKSLKQYIG